MATSLGNCGIQGAGPGRPKGSLNRFTNLKNAFLEAFERTGGIDSRPSGESNRRIGGISIDC